MALKAHLSGRTEAEHLCGCARREAGKEGFVVKEVFFSPWKRVRHHGFILLWAGCGASMCLTALGMFALFRRSQHSDTACRHSAEPSGSLLGASLHPFIHCPTPNTAAGKAAQPPAAKKYINT